MIHLLVHEDISIS